MRRSRAPDILLMGSAERRSAASPGVLTSRQINTTAPLTGGGDLTADRTLAIPASTDAVDGYLTAADHASLTTAASLARTFLLMGA